MRYPFIHAERQRYPVRLLCAVLQVSRSGYDRFVRGGGGQAQPDPALLVQVQRLHRASRGTYGSRRLCVALKQAGCQVGRHRTRTLMRQTHRQPRRVRRRPHTTDSRHTSPIAPNLLNRQFAVTAPNRVWGSDITALWTQEGWRYIALVVDLVSRKVVGWACAASMGTRLITRAFHMAVGQRQPAPGLLHHSDRGSQYASAEYQSHLRAAGMICRMSRKGNCYDNAVVERVFRSLKEEAFSEQPPDSRAHATLSVIDDLAMFYNSQRLHSTLGYQSPTAFESQAAGLNRVGYPGVWTKERSAYEGQI
jgi:putative transposase